MVYQFSVAFSLSLLDFCYWQCLPYPHAVMLHCTRPIQAKTSLTLFGPQYFWEIKVCVFQYVARCFKPGHTSRGNLSRLQSSYFWDLTLTWLSNELHLMSLCSPEYLTTIWHSPDHHLTFTWRSPDVHLTLTWRSTDHYPYLTLISCWKLKKGWVGGLPHYKP